MCVCVRVCAGKRRGGEGGGGVRVHGHVALVGVLEFQHVFLDEGKDGEDDQDEHVGRALCLGDEHGRGDVGLFTCGATTRGDWGRDVDVVQEDVVVARVLGKVLGVRC